MLKECCKKGVSRGEVGKSLVGYKRNRVGEEGMANNPQQLKSVRTQP